MKDIVKILLAIFMIFTLTGCVKKTNFEDKDLTKFFIETNKDKLDKFYQINSFEVFQVGHNEINTSIDNSFIDWLTPSFSYGNYIQGCNYVLSISSNKVEFSDIDIINHGKEFMYKEAQQCLDSVIKKIEQDRKDR